MGRFISADTIVPDPANPQSYNRYSYVYNQPLNLTDPTGHCPCLVDGGPGFADGSFIPTGDNVPQVLTDSELGAIGNAASLVPYLDTGDDFLTATTGCGYACQAGNEEPVGGFWRGVAAAAIIAPVSGSVIRHGAEEVAGLLGRFGDDAITLYRAVSPDELDDVLETGIFRPKSDGHSMDAKWFSETYEGSVEWGNRMFEEFTVLSVTIPTNVADEMYRVTNMDGIANARAAIDEVLDKFNQNIRQIRVEE